MNKEMLQFLTGMTEEQILNEAKNIGLDTREEEALNKGKDFFDKYMKLDNANSQKRVILTLIAYGIINNNKGGK